uniref:Uncharacterized protein n=1 Tax=Avena sativa TaxID=4498 RepID=A0ACD5WTT1_AVESA
MGKKKGSFTAGSVVATVVANKKSATTTSTSAAAVAGKKKGPGTHVTNGSWSPSIIKPSELFTQRQDGAQRMTPVFPAMRGLLCFYGLQLHQLTPNSILHIACFITLCECWLGIEPHFGLFKKLFKLKCQSGWREKWFYIHDQKVDGEHYGLVPFDPMAACKRRRSWKNVVMPDEVEETETLYQRVCDLERHIGKEVGGADLIHTWMRRQVQPLHARVHPMCRWIGTGDVTRIFAEGISSGEVDMRFRLLTKYTTKEDLPGDSVVPPFCASHPPPEDWKVAANLPPQPEGIIPREAEEEDESGSTVPIGEEQEAPESSGHGTHKHSRSKDSDASSPMMPKGPPTAVEEPIPAMLVRAMAPPSRKKLSQMASSSSDDCQFFKESGVTDSKNKEGHQIVARTSILKESSESLEEHNSARLAEQIVSLGRQHAMLDNRHHAVEGEHNELLCHVKSLEKGLAAAEKKCKEAVEA